MRRIVLVVIGSEIELHEIMGFLILVFRFELIRKHYELIAFRRLAVFVPIVLTLLNQPNAYILADMGEIESLELLIAVLNWKIRVFVRKASEDHAVIVSIGYESDQHPGSDFRNIGQPASNVFLSILIVRLLAQIRDRRSEMRPSLYVGQPARPDSPAESEKKIDPDLAKSVCGQFHHVVLGVIAFGHLRRNVGNHAYCESRYGHRTPMVVISEHSIESSPVADIHSFVFNCHRHTALCP